MYMIMKAEIFKDGAWHQVQDKIFQSALQEDLFTDRVCDERNHILYEILGAPKTCHFEHTPINTMGTYDEKTHTGVVYLDELVKYDWCTSVARIGIISEWQYERLKHDGIEPANKSAHIFDSNAKLVSPSEMDMILANKDLRDASKYYVRYEYDAQPLNELCDFFCNITLPSLIKLIPEDGTTKDVRAVYSFKYIDKNAF